jgi:hypothetical protein
MQVAKHKADRFWQIVKLWWPKRGPKKYFWQLTLELRMNEEQNP